MERKKCTLVTGGVKSGKSRFALGQALKMDGHRTFIATAQAFDEAMAKRIKEHQKERGSYFATAEEPLYIAQALGHITPQTAVVVIDCLTVWLNNLFYHFQEDEDKIASQTDLLLEALTHPVANIILVTNEIGLGVMPENRMARGFIDALGALNQKTAALSDEVIMMIAGVPQIVKGGHSYATLDHTGQQYTPSQP